MVSGGGGVVWRIGVSRLEEEMRVKKGGASAGRKVPKSMPAAALGGVTPFLTVKAALMPSSVKNVLDPSTSGGASAS